MVSIHQNCENTIMVYFKVTNIFVVYCRVSSYTTRVVDVRYFATFSGLTVVVCLLV